MNDLQNAVITIAERSDKLAKNGKMAKLKSSDGKTYNVFEKKADGTTSVAWEQLSELEIGDSVQIGYSESPYTLPDGKEVTTKNIRSFNKDIGQGMMNAQSQGKTLNHEAPRPLKNDSGTSGTDAFGRRLGIQGHINALLSNPTYFNTRSIDLASIKGLVQFAIQIEDEAERQLNPSPLRAAVQKHAPSVVEEPLPSHDINDDVNVEDIPF
jgi:hypothetical protein